MARFGGFAQEHALVTMRKATWSHGMAVSKTSTTRCWEKKRSGAAKSAIAWRRALQTMSSGIGRSRINAPPGLAPTRRSLAIRSYKVKPTLTGGWTAFTPKIDLEYWQASQWHWKVAQ